MHTEKSHFERWCDVIEKTPSGVKPRESDVNDIPDNVLLGRVLKHIASRRRGRVKVPLWSVVVDQFALGSTYAAQLCRRFGLDPDQIVRK